MLDLQIADFSNPVHASAVVYHQHGSVALGGDDFDAVERFTRCYYLWSDAVNNH